jgi:hypothetical protein
MPPLGMEVDESAVPKPGHPVAVLHADGIWYTGRLIAKEGEENAEGESRWSIQFDDGDTEWYTLPHRSASLPRLLRPSFSASSSCVVLQLFSGDIGPLRFQSTSTHFPPFSLSL